ncbi:tubulin polyglutamylase TTLL13-like isoform X2 [Acropora palmata]|uniref:tubulin polyglutamylase TTLL13-like isoform X2 n=1 Tax=Acropora palmata TaxID=6131 RepID=UPI003DA1AB21
MADNEIEGEGSDNESDVSFHCDTECEGEDSGGEVPEQLAEICYERTATPKKGKSKRKKKRWMSVCLTSCKYESVRRVTKRFGMKEVGEDEDWTLFWTDCSVALERCMEMKRYQKINHFPGMSEICRKDLLARNMNRLWKQFPKDYAVFPKTWCLPADYGEFQAYCRQKKNKTFILKPDSGSQGKGIFLTKNPKDVKPGEHMVCQQYVSKPFLIDGFKFDLRVYVLVTSCDPLRIFVYDDGLGRFATMKYMDPSNSNLDDICMHLTNYAVNKHSKDFIRDEESGSKRRITTINKWFEENGYDVKEIWDAIEDVIIKTLITAHPILKHNYRTCFPNHNKGSACFEILGFDILLDRKLKAWVLEVNHSPSFTTDSPLDKEIKDGLMFDALNLLNFGACDRRKILEEDKRRVRDRLLQKQRTRESRKEDVDSQFHYIEWLKKYEDSHLGKYRRIYPEGNEEKYAVFFENSCSLFQETTASKARIECARVQREQIVAKQQEEETARLKNCGRIPKGSKDGLRPESPHSRRTRRPSVRKMLHASKKRYEGKRAGQEQLDTTKPIAISEEEELERITSLLQRDNLIRGLGVVEFVYKLLHCTPGTGGPQKNCTLHHSNNQNNSKDLAMRNASMGGRELGSSLANSVTYGSMGILSTAGTGASGNKASITHLSRFQTYQPTALSAVINMNAQQAAPTLTRNDRRALASVGIVPSAPTGLPKHRYCSTKAFTRSMPNVEYDWKSGTYVGIDSGNLAYGMIDPRMDNQSNATLRRRTYSASGFKVCADSVHTNGTRGSRAMATNLLGGSQTNLSSPGGMTPSAQAQQYMCSMYTFPNVLKVAPQPQNGMNLSVISGPAPVSYRPSPVNSTEPGQTNSSHRIDSSSPGLLRSTKAQRVRGATNSLRLKIELRENHAAVLS